MKRKKKPEAVVYVPETDSDLTGRVAVSNNGRFAGRMFVILGASGDGFVLVADGKHRRIALPKRKSLKHLTLLDGDETAAELIRSGNVTDGLIRKMINQKRRISEDRKCLSES